MARIYPSKSVIKSLKTQPTSGEQKLLDFLENILDDSFEVYFQPHLNGLLPDIVIMRQYYGVMIIEVKDYDLRCYSIEDAKADWHVTDGNGNSGNIRSPLEQVELYKLACCNLYIRNLAEKIILQKKHYAIIQCAVFFSESSTKELEKFFKNKLNDEYINLLGYDSLTEDNFSNILRKNYLIGYRKSRYFTDDLYLEFKRVLQPSIHTLEEAFNKNIVYTNKQIQLSHSFAPRQTKIRGVAGSGKTRVLAKLAVNAYLRTKSPVLILTFNITLRNYIHDMISDVRENFPWSAFDIIHYHILANYYKGRKYSTILVDEVQDYKSNWINEIHKFLQENGEIVFFGDEKQNIYRRELVSDNDSKRPYTKIRGRWNELNTTFRLKNRIAMLANDFQKAFFLNQYEYEALKPQESDLFSKEPAIEYYYFDKLFAEEIYKIYYDFVKEKHLNDDDVCFLGTKVATVRLIESVFLKRNFRTCSTFENEKVFCELKKRRLATKDILQKIRRPKKFNFWLESGTVKFSTIHSFKGWEMQTVFLILDFVTIDDSEELPQCSSSNQEEIISELIYTGITRAQTNLIIINIGGKRYDKFFKSSPIINIPAN